MKLSINILPFANEDISWDCFTVQKGNNAEKDWAYRQRSLFLGKSENYTDLRDIGRGYYIDDKAKFGMDYLKKNSDEFLSRLGYEKTNFGNGYKEKEKNDKRIAVFCHQGFALHWIAYLLNIPYHIFTASFDISYTGVTIIKFEGENTDKTAYPLCLCFCDLSHLYAEKLSMEYNDCIEV